LSFSWSAQRPIGLARSTVVTDDGKEIHTRRGREIIDDDAHVVHPFDHGDSPSSSRGPSWPLVSLGRSQRHILDTRKRAEF